MKLGGKRIKMTASLSLQAFQLSSIPASQLPSLLAFQLSSIPAFKLPSLLAFRHRWSRYYEYITIRFGRRY